MSFKHPKEEQHACEILWAREKYAVLARSQRTYLRVRNRLKDKAHPDYVAVQNMIETAKAAPPNPKDAVNAATHVWGYFKHAATAAEHRTFFDTLHDFKAGSCDESVLRGHLYRLLSRYPNTYLQESTYFDDVRQPSRDE
ncbi:MAG: YbgA family protein [Eubacteriales bacterium]|nr:YbgA family protein [Eubacteriales bacterium]